ncbi:TPA: hypothetical protein HA241_07625 [Candidatus Woesearchaeota archaeon]|nr:hypothetical protein [Candidatus Woesearchaeota archaeon]
MVFIGSKKYLSVISNVFKDIWITFIREFNRSFSRKSTAVNVLKERVSSLQQKAAILRNEVVKKIGVTADNDNETTLDLTALSLELGKLIQEFKDFSEQLSLNQGLMQYAQIKESLVLLEIRIKKVKDTISLAADSVVRSSRRKFLKKTVVVSAKTVIALLASGSGLTWALHHALTQLAKGLPSKKDGLAILISYGVTGFWDDLLRKNADFFIPMYVARIELAIGQKANVVKKAATGQDFYDVLRDDSIQNIVLFGHGSWYSWQATDMCVISSDLWIEPGEVIRDTRGPVYEEGFPQRKKGYLVRHTCGEGRSVQKQKVILIEEGVWNDLQARAEQINNSLSALNYILKIEKKQLPGAPRGGVEYINVSVLTTVNGRIAIPDHYAPPLFCFYFRNREDVPFSEEMENIVFVLKNNKPLFIEFKQFIQEVRTVVGKQIELPVEDQPLLGTPVFRRENIKGWDRLTNPIDFMLNVFGQKEKKLDELYS